MNKHIFTNLEYNSGDGMMTSIWGPPLWHVLHTISFNYPINPSDKQKKQYFNFYNSLQHILPCKYCRDNLKKNLEELPLVIDVFKNRNSLSRYVYQLHEIINTMLGKKSNLSYDDVRERYEHFRSRCINPIDSTDNNPDIEKGCTEPLYGVKSKCVLNIVPKNINGESLYIDDKCILTKNLNKKMEVTIDKIKKDDGFMKIGRSRRSKRESKKRSKRELKRGSKIRSKRGSKKRSKN